jgi:DNA-binding MltR family transcriptional regulator
MPAKRKKQPNPARRKFLAPQLLDEIHNVKDSIDAESDLACALKGGALIEKALKTLMAGMFRDTSDSDHFLDDVGGLLGPPSVKNRLAYCLYLIEKEEFQGISTLLRIRNAFAHSHETVDFKADHIVALCNQLKLENDILRKLSKGGQPIDSRARFWAAVKHYFELITLAARSEEGTM